MHISTEQRRQSFSVWLRTGRWPRPCKHRGLEFKFNPWHDPSNGQFTFAGAGRYYGRGGARSPSAGNDTAPKIEDVGRPDGQSTLPQDRPRSARGGIVGGGGDYGGGGASGSWQNSPAPRVRRTMEADRPLESGSGVEQAGLASHPVAAPRLPASDADRWRRISRNGYLYEIDERDRTRRVSGELTLNPDQGRSRTVQRAAGGGDRRPSDHGGHYIARRFNGPTEAFNHFGQDGNFNRGKYARLEEQWARAKRTGKDVRVKIAPAYEGASQRPVALNVWFSIDGERKSLHLPNEPKGTRDGE